MHFATHLRKGAGFRYVLDYYYMLRKTKIDYELLHSLNERLKLSRLYSNIINTIRMIFDVDFDETIKKEDVSFFY